MTSEHAEKLSASQILIVGASGELGGALAARLARPGARLALWGRDAARLEAAAARCRAAGAVAQIRQIDLRDLPAALAALAAEEAEAPIDLAIFAAGQGDIRGPDDAVEPAEQIARLITVNFTAPAALTAALAGHMAGRGGGRIAIVGSAAAFHGLPFAAGYAGGKAGLTRFAEALALDVRRHGVTVTLVSPGFIDTAAARRVPGPKPLQMTADAAAGAILAAVARGRRHAIMPWPFALLRWLDRLLPAPLRDRLLLALAPPSHRGR